MLPANLPVPLVYLASISNRSRTWYFGQIRYRRIKAIKCGGQVLIPHEEVCRLLAAGRIVLDPDKLPASPEPTDNG